MNAAKRIVSHLLGETVYGEPAEDYLVGNHWGEHVIAAAIRVPNGDIFIGTWHADAAHKAESSGWEEPDDYREGFYTSSGRYVSRAQGLRLARKARQLAPHSLRSDYHDHQGLDSSDMQPGAGLALPVTRA